MRELLHDKQIGTNKLGSAVPVYVHALEYFELDQESIKTDCGCAPVAVPPVSLHVQLLWEGLVASGSQRQKIYQHASKIPVRA